MRLALASVLWALHVVVVLFIAIAWLLPWSWALWTAAIGFPLVQLNWWAFDDRCFLTVIEEKLRGEERVRYAPEDAQRSTSFVAELLSRVLERPIPHRVGHALSYGFVWGGFAVAVLRLWLRSGG